jgi:hypothetical protein
MIERKTPRLRGRRGVALPVALVGLVAVSLLVTTAVLTSSTEYAISSAHSNGARSLYDAESGLQEYVRQFSMLPGALAVGQTQTIVLAQTGGRVQVTPARLGQAGATITYALVAQPVNAADQPLGRAVVAMIRQNVPPANPLSTNITSAITLGGNLHVNGNAFTVSGYDNCTEAGHTREHAQAVRASEESDVTTNNSRHMDRFIGVDEQGNAATGADAMEISDLSRAELARDVLGGTTVQALAAAAPSHKKWGPMFQRPNWGGFLHRDTLIAVVDADGGMVDVTGGEGLLLVLNGGIQMRGNASFKGIIIAEGNFDLRGTPTVEGALISLAMDGLNEIDLDDSAIGAGHVTVRYNRCEIARAQQAWGQVAGQQPPTIIGQTFGWYEVVR